MLKGVQLKIILLLSLVLLVSISPDSEAQVPYLATFDTQNIFGWQYISAAYQLFDVYVWVYPGEDGLICADFKMDKPEWVVHGTTTFNAEVIIGIVQDLPYDEDGARVCLSSCAYEPIWLCRVTHIPTVAGLQGEIHIIPRPSIGQVQVATCLEGNPVESANVFCWFGLNYEPPCYVSNRTATWGTIKAIYDE